MGYPFPENNMYRQISFLLRIYPRGALCRVTSCGPRSWEKGFAFGRFALEPGLDARRHGEGADDVMSNLRGEGGWPSRAISDELHMGKFWGWSFLACRFLVLGEEDQNRIC